MLGDFKMKRSNGINSYWHSYTFRHLLRGIAARYPKTYKKVGTQLHINGVFKHRVLRPDDDPTREELLREFLAFVAAMPPHIIPYSDFGDNRQWHEINWLKEYKSYLKDIPVNDDERFELNSKYAINGDETR